MSQSPEVHHPTKYLFDDVKECLDYAKTLPYKTFIVYQHFPAGSVSLHRCTKDTDLRLQDWDSTTYIEL